MLGCPIRARTDAEQSKGSLRCYGQDFRKSLAAFLPAYIIRHYQKLPT